MNFTEYYPGNINPVRKGVYQTRAERFKYWNGSFWGLRCETTASAKYHRTIRPFDQNEDWRGVAK